MSTNSLWGDIPINQKIETPGSILEEQAIELSNATKELLQGNIGRNTTAENKFVLEFRIHAPLVGNYQYEVCRIVHDIALYPVRIMDSTDQKLYEANSVEEFRKTLATIFQKPRLRSIITSLIAQSRS